jgi:hypothetical protein
MDSSDAFSLRTCINGDVINFSEIDKSETSLVLFFNKILIIFNSFTYITIILF